MTNYLPLFTTQKSLEEMPEIKESRQVTIRGYGNRVSFIELGKNFGEAYEKMVKKFYEFINCLPDKNNIKKSMHRHTLKGVV